MMLVANLVDRLEEWFPPGLAESWDNVGLLLGDRHAKLERVMTCLTVTPETVAEAVAEQADVIVSHHPIFFRPVQRLVADGPSREVYQLARAGIAVYSPHTALDSALAGINQQIAERLGLRDIRPLRSEVADDASANAPAPPVGAGRWGRLEPPLPLDDLGQQVGAALGVDTVDVVGPPSQRCQTVAIACGAGGEFLADALRLKLDVLLTGEARFHDGLRAQAEGVGLVLAGHYATERFAVETLADRLAHALAGVTVWASRRERDPFRRVYRTSREPMA